MRDMNLLEDKKVGLLGKTAISLGDKFATLSTEPKGCWLALLYEPELPEELIDEMLNVK